MRCMQRADSRVVKGFAEEEIKLRIVQRHRHRETPSRVVIYPGN